MVSWYWLLITLFIGGFVGVLVTSLCVIAKQSDRTRRRLR